MLLTNLLFHSICFQLQTYLSAKSLVFLNVETFETIFFNENHIFQNNFASSFQCKRMKVFYKFISHIEGSERAHSPTVGHLSHYYHYKLPLSVPHF